MGSKSYCRGRLACFQWKTVEVCYCRVWVCVDYCNKLGLSKLDIDRVVFLLGVENQLLIGLRAFRVAVFVLPHVGSGGCCGQLGGYQNASIIIM